VDFFNECLTHVKGRQAGQPLKLERWQQAIVGNLFGWKRPDGLRRYRECLVYVPRKNGKTTLAAGIVCLVGFCDGEPGAEIYSAAGDRDQASIVREIVKQMIRQDAELTRRAEIFQHSVVFTDTNSSYRSISAEAGTKHGYNSHLVVIDELHVQKDRELVDTLTTSTGARAQPLVLYITTADHERESICNEVLAYAERVRDGVIEDASFLPVIYSVDVDDDWTKPKAWRMANPNLGVSVSKEHLAAECQKAREVPARENTFRRLHLNVKTQQETRWLPLERWDACEGDVDPDELVGQECFGGLDLSSTRDLSAFDLYFPKTNAVLAWHWVPADNAPLRERRDRVPYMTWSRQGLVTLTPGNVVDYDRIRADVCQIAQRYAIREIAVDRWNSEHLQQLLAAEGLTIVPFGQGFASMSAPTKALEKLVVGGQLAHGGNPMLRWQAANVTVELDSAENIKPSKKRSAERIDGIVALVMAIGRAIVQPEIRKSVYEDRGLMSL